MSEDNLKMRNAQIALAINHKKESKMKMKKEETQILAAAKCATPPSMTALQVVENADALQKIGQFYAASGFFGAVSASTATASFINAALEGISPLEYRAKYHTFENGTTSIKSDYIQREFHRLGGEWKFNEWTAEVCDMSFTYKGDTLPMRVTLAEFKANGVACVKEGKTLKDNWRKFPREMLKARCMATAIRALCPEALGGMYTQEEVADFDRKPIAVSGTASPSPIATEKKQVVEVVDYAVCPCGKSKGKRFDELPTETLEKIASADAAKFPLITPEHRNEIVRILGERETTEGND